MSKKKRKVKRRLKYKNIFLIIFILSSIGLSAHLIINKINFKGRTIIDDFKEITIKEREDKNYNFTTNIDKLEIYYLALNGKKTLEIEFNSKEGYDNTITWTVDDESIVAVEDNVIKGIGVGTTTITGEMKNGYKKSLDIMVTDLIVPPKVNYKKSYLPCERYTEEEAELLDKILASRVEEGGRGARGGVVAAARFLTLEFPYDLRYFNEPGRLVNHGTRPHVDGEGRFYHQGLYLSKSKFEILEKGASRTGPAIWGCKLYDTLAKRYGANGFTCSGFVTWAMYNGGFDVGDVGAGNLGYDDDLWALGPHHKITLSYMQGNTYKPGDFIARNGHAALIIGFDETTLYTAESLPPKLKVYTYGRYDNKTKLPGHSNKGIVVDENLNYVVEMSEIYPNGDGWAPNMWES